MSTAIQRRRGTTAQHSSFAGLAGELTVDTDKKTVVVHDGTTAGGMPLLPKTMSDGTANGVLYLNGSKVATSGTALTFDGTNLGVGAGGVSAGLLRVWSGSNDKRIQLSNDGTVSIINSTYGSSGASPLVFKISDDEQMRLTSTGLGIGTSSPGYKLDIAGASGVAINIANTSDSNRGGRIVVAGSSASGTVALNTTSSGYGITFGIDSTEKMRLDTSGNLGLGVTPSAWNNSIKALQVNNAALASFTNGGNVQTWLANNAYYDNATGWLYKNSSVGAALYAQNFNGSHNWNIAPSGTAGNAITFTQALTLDASGNLLVGSTSTSGLITGQLQLGTTSSSTAGIQVLNSTTGVGGIYFGDSSSGNARFRGMVEYNHTADALVLSTAETERARIDSSGNLILGSTSAIGKLSVWSAANGDTLAAFRCAGTGTQRGLYIYGDNSTGVLKLDATGAAGGTLAFATGGTETARIDSSGRFMVGKTSFSATTTGFQVNGDTGSSSFGSCTSTLAASVNANTTYEAYSTGASAYRFYVGMGGTVYATSTTITAISDQRLKENIRDLDDGLASVMALKPRKFDWKEGKGANIKDARGFIAQEFETVFPDMIEEWRDPAPEGEEPYKAINANLIPTLVKAIQEQQAQIESLRKRLADAGIA